MTTESRTLSASDLELAYRRIAPHVHRTPLVSSRRAGERVGRPVHLKCENLQRSGSFKIRGATNAVLSLTDDARRRGVVTYSSGNHGQALAFAAREAGVRAVIYMPTHAATPKVEAARGYGAEVRFAGTTSKERKLAAEEAVAREGLEMVPPFDDERIVAGQGTVGLEILEQCRDVGAILVPTGGGGLLAGVALAVRSQRPDIAVIGVEPLTGNAMAAALAAGAPQEIATPTSIADGLLPVKVGRINHELAARYVSGTAVVSEEAILEAMRFVLSSCKLLVEPSGCVGLAALFSGAVVAQELIPADRSIVCVLSGGNVEMTKLAGWLSER